MKVIRPDDPEVSEKEQDSCTACHRDNNRAARARQLKQWQDEYQETMSKLQDEIQNIDSLLKRKPGILNHELYHKLETLRTNLEILQQDRSRGANNLDYALEIMAQAARDLRAIKSAPTQ